MAREPSGRLVPVDVKSIWPDEAREFTPWLASEEGLSLLSDELGMELELEGTEVPVGPFSADIVANDANSNEKVVIENQLDRTNHDHLGKCLVYASGLDATVVVWVAREFTKEHRKALDILNKVASPAMSFYGVEVRLWSIGESPPAPQFNVVARPDEFVQPVLPRMTSTKSTYLEYWQTFRDKLALDGTFLKPRKPRPQHWYSLAVGRSRFGIHLLVSTTRRNIGCELYISGANAGAAFRLLKEDKDAIEAVLGPLEWMELPKKMATRIIQRKLDVDIKDKATWSATCDWHKDRAEAFHKVFSQRVRALELPELDAEEDIEDESETEE